MQGLYDIVANETTETDVAITSQLPPLNIAGKGGPYKANMTAAMQINVAPVGQIPHTLPVEQHTRRKKRGPCRGNLTAAAAGHLFLSLWPSASRHERPALGKTWVTLTHLCR